MASPRTGGAGAAASFAAAREALAKGRVDEASALAQEALAAGADRIELLLLLGEIFLRRGLAGEALERFRAVEAGLDEEANDPSPRQAERAERCRVEALEGAARALLELGRLDEALAESDRLRALDPGSAFAYRLQGRIFLRREEPVAAVEQLERALELGGEDATTLTDLGVAYGLAGSLGEAESALRRAVEREPAGVAARTELGHVLRRSHRLNEAASQYMGALGALPSYAPAALALAELERERGQVRAAIDVLVELLMLDPTHSTRSRGWRPAA